MFFPNLPDDVQVFIFALNLLGAKAVRSCRHVQASELIFLVQYGESEFWFCNIGFSSTLCFEPIIFSRFYQGLDNRGAHYLGDHSRKTR
jgi:hypothetical protein